MILFLFWFVSFHYHSFRSQKRLTSEFLWLFWIFFILFRFFNLLGAILFFWGFFLYVGEEVFFIIHKQIFDDFSIFLYIFFLYIGIFFLEALLENNPRKKSCFCSSFLFIFSTWLYRFVFFVFGLIFLWFFLTCFQIEFVFLFLFVLQNTLISILFFLKLRDVWKALLTFIFSLGCYWPRASQAILRVAFWTQVYSGLWAWRTATASST